MKTGTVLREVSKFEAPVGILRANGSVLEEAERIINGERQADYAHPFDDFNRVVGMINALFAHKLKESFRAEEWPLIMECVKMSREVHLHKRDNLVDGAGYWGTLEMVIAERERRAYERSTKEPVRD